MATSELEQVITTNGNVIIKEEISLGDTDKELQKSEWNCTAYSVKFEQSDLELVQNWPVSGLVKNEAFESTEKNKQNDYCEADAIKLEELHDVQQELVTDTVKTDLEQCISTCNENIIVKDEVFIQDEDSDNKDACFEAENIKSEPLVVQKDLIRFWRKNELSNSLEQIEVVTESGQDACFEAENIKSEPLVVRKDLIRFWPKNELSNSLEHIDVMTESGQEMCAGKKNVITGGHIEVHKDCLLSDDGQVVLKNFSEDDMYCSVENNITGSLGCSHSERNAQYTKRNARNECSLRHSDTFHSSIRQQNLNMDEKSIPPKLVTQTTPVKYTKIKNYICDVCNKSFSRRYALVRHKLIHEVKNFHCSVCTKSFTHSDTFLRHKLLHSGDKKYRCDVCNKTFTESYECLQHKKIHSGDKNYCCDVCNNTFTQSSNLLRHQLIHSDVKNYRCNICDKAFRQKDVLSQHKLVHSGLKRHKCEECGKTFARSNTLTRHKVTHSGIRKYRCDVCGKTFSRSYTLLHHKFTHMDVYKNQCDICNKTFSMSYSLTKHKLIHEGKKVYRCDKCNKDFYHMTSLKNHKLSHNECKRYQCSNCNEGFMSKCDLKRHVLIHMMVDSNDEN